MPTLSNSLTKEKETIVLFGCLLFLFHKGVLKCRRMDCPMQVSLFLKCKSWCSAIYKRLVIWKVLLLLSKNLCWDRMPVYFYKKNGPLIQHCPRSNSFLFDTNNHMLLSKRGHQRACRGQQELKALNTFVLGCVPAVLVSARDGNEKKQ